MEHVYEMLGYLTSTNSHLHIVWRSAVPRLQTTPVSLALSQGVYNVAYTVTIILSSTSHAFTLKLLLGRTQSRTITTYSQFDNSAVSIVATTSFCHTTKASWHTDRTQRTEKLACEQGSDKKTNLLINRSTFINSCASDFLSQPAVNFHIVK